MSTHFKDQQCNVAGLAIGWIAYGLGLGYFAYHREWTIAFLWMAGMPALRWTLYHFFPRISRFLGYGRIIDAIPSVLPSYADPQKSRVTVNFYSFFSCPFCPIVLGRLQALQPRMGFILHVIDVTLKPQMLVAKGIKSVPVVEVGEHRLVGNSTTAQLAALIASAAAPGSAGAI